MKVRITAGGNAERRLVNRVEIVSAAVRRRLARELRDELQFLAQSERSADPETRRDALERAVRRIWGGTL